MLGRGLLCDSIVETDGSFSFAAVSITGADWGYCLDGGYLDTGKWSGRPNKPPSLPLQIADDGNNTDNGPHADRAMHSPALLHQPAFTASYFIFTVTTNSVLPHPKLP